MAVPATAKTRAVYFPKCDFCTGVKVKPAAKRGPKPKYTPEERVLRHRASTAAWFKSRSEKDPAFSDRWRQWDRKNPDYQAIRRPLAMQNKALDFNEIRPDKSASNPSEATGLGLWMEENLTKREFEAVSALSETLSEQKAAKELGWSFDYFTTTLKSAREKAKELDKTD